MTIKEIEIQLALGTLSYEIKYKLARNLNTPKEILVILSKDKNWCIRYNVTFNSNTPPKILTRLLRDKDSGVRYTAKKRLRYYEKTTTNN